MEIRLSTEEPIYTAAPQPPEVGGDPARSPHVPSRPPEPSNPDPIASDRVRFWRAGALLWEAV